MFLLDYLAGSVVWLISGLHPSTIGFVPYFAGASGATVFWVAFAHLTGGIALEATYANKEAASQRILKVCGNVHSYLIGGYFIYTLVRFGDTIVIDWLYPILDWTWLRPRAPSKT